jgi:hypothetical protein
MNTVRIRRGTDEQVEVKNSTFELKISTIEQIKELKKMFKKGSFEQIDTEDFQARLKFEPPYPDEDEQHVVRFSAKTTYKDKKSGEQKPLEYDMDLHPKIYEVVNGESIDISKTKYVNNGSKGSIVVAVSDTSFGTMAYLKAVYLDYVNEYIKPE